VAIYRHLTSNRFVSGMGCYQQLSWNSRTIRRKVLTVKRALILAGLLLLGITAFCQNVPSTPTALVHFVAPPYPREAKDQRIMGTTVSKLSVAKDGSVERVTTIRAHPVFEKAVWKALKQWRFKPSPDSYSLEVTFSFEFYDEDCNKSLTPETQVSAELPTLVTIRTGLQCVQVQTSSSKQ
jgi:TonB family protein